MPYFPAGGGVGYRAPTTQFSRPQAIAGSYRQAARGTRGRFGQSLSDILGTISDVAGTISDDTGSSSSSYYTMSPQPAAPSAGLSTTTLLLGAAVLGGVFYFATKK